MSAERALAAGVRAALQANAPVRALIGDPIRLADGPGDTPVFPFATFGAQQTRDAGSAAIAALEHALTLHVWSRYDGRAEAADIVAAIRNALETQTVSVAGHRLVLLFVLFTDVFRAADGRTFHGVVRLRALTEKE